MAEKIKLKHLSLLMQHFCNSEEQKKDGQISYGYLTFNYFLTFCSSFVNLSMLKSDRKEKQLLQKWEKGNLRKKILPQLLSFLFSVLRFHYFEQSDYVLIKTIKLKKLLIKSPGTY